MYFIGAKYKQYKTYVSNNCYNGDNNNGKINKYNNNTNKWEFSSLEVDDFPCNSGIKYHRQN